MIKNFNNILIKFENYTVRWRIKYRIKKNSFTLRHDRIKQANAEMEETHELIRSQ